MRNLDSLSWIGMSDILSIARLKSVQHTLQDHWLTGGIEQMLCV